MDEGRGSGRRLGRPSTRPGSTPRVVLPRYGGGSTSRLDRITTDPGIGRGQPTVRGLRYPVEMLLELFASGMATDEVVTDYPDLEVDDVLAALEYGARQIIPLRAG